MVWLALIALTVWLVIQQSNLGDLKREIALLRQRLADPPIPPPATASGITPAMEAAARAAASAAWPAIDVRARAAAPPLASAPVVGAAPELVEFSPSPPPPHRPSPRRRRSPAPRSNAGWPRRDWPGSAVRRW